MLPRILCLSIVAACSGAPSHAPVAVTEPASCSTLEHLIANAIAAANRAAVHPDDPAARSAVLTAAAELALHTHAHHAEDTQPDMRGALAVEPYLERELAKVTACSDKLAVARILRYLRLPSAVRAWDVDARACLSGLDAASLCGFVDDANQVIAETWPRARPEDKLPMLDALDRCDNRLFAFDRTVEQDAPFLSFLSPDELAYFYPIMKEHHAARLDRLAGEDTRRAAQANLMCHDDCLSMYGEGDSLCARTCAERCGYCADLVRSCSAECDELVPAPRPSDD